MAVSVLDAITMYFFDANIMTMTHHHPHPQHCLVQSSKVSERERDERRFD